MKKEMIHVAYHRDADQRRVNKLAKEFGRTLLAAVEAQRALNRPGQACVGSDGYLLVAGDREDAHRQGFPLRAGAAMYVIGMPDDCELARNILKRLQNDPNAMHVELCEGETT